MHVTTLMKNENAEGPRAEVYQGPDGYYVEYYGSNGLMIEKTNYDDHNIASVTNIAERWVNSIKVLNG